MVPIIPLKPLFQKTISTIIAPHGITDIMHAKQYNLTTELVQINGFGLVYSHVLHFTSPDVMLHTVFLLSSIIHFRHDMPRIYDIPRYIFSGLIISLFSFFPILFFPYMVLLHVPNHYRMNWNVIKTNVRHNFRLLLLFTIGCYFGGEIIFDNFFTSYVIDIAKGVVIAHIAYEELYIHSIGNGPSIS